ncbi:ketosteroid isomerase-like protein [Lewinella marina]|nr:nuclear transport factor 2 family protein [Neolewinella marina]NJB85919.1 ketosteroid isomerase-like protein [Neolewinella marina]
MRLPHLLLALLLLPILSLKAQDTPQATLQRLFDGMRRADTSGMGELFLPGASLHSVTTDAAGATTLQIGDIGRWMSGIVNAQPGALDEQLHFTSLRTDGALATAWTPYTFVLNGEVHHCGTNAFQLINDGGWRILNIVDTRRAEGCAPVDSLAAVARIEQLADDWHRAAARADSAAYFGRMTADAIYIGTDPGEHWTREEFAAFAAPYFAAGKAWDFTATERHVFYDEDNNLAYFDELLDTWMGTCRGTGIVRRTGNNEWKIAHYTLSLTVPNDQMDAVISVIRGQK